MRTKELLLEQGSDEWLAVRSKHITGTEVAHLWSGIVKMPELRDLKLGITKFPDISHQPQVKEGHFFEPLIRNYLATTPRFRANICPKTGVIATPCLESQDEPFFMVSLDGIAESGFPIEIKNSYSATKDLKAYEDVCKNGPNSRTGRQNGYYAQVQWEMYLTGAPFALFVTHKSNDGVTLCPENIRGMVVRRDDKVISELITLAKGFKEYMQTGILPTLEVGDKTIISEDSVSEEIKNLLGNFLSAERAYATAKAEADKLKKAKDELTEKLVNNLPKGKNKLQGILEGLGQFSISRETRQGAIDYDKLMKSLIEKKIITPDEIEVYRKADTISKRVRIKES